MGQNTVGWGQKRGLRPRQDLLEVTPGTRVLIPEPRLHSTPHRTLQALRLLGTMMRNLRLRQRA